MSESFARGDKVFVASKDSSLAIVAADISTTSARLIDDARTGLKSAMSLGNSKATGRRRASLEPGPAGIGAAAANVLPDIQLQSSVVVNVPATEIPKVRTGLVGELNREGIVRARRLQVRDGAIYLEGEDSGNKQGGVSIDRPALEPRHPLASE